MAKIREWHVVITVQCRGPSFVDDIGRIRPEYRLVPVLEDIIDDIDSGVAIELLHNSRLRSRSGDDVGFIIVAGPDVLSELDATEE